MLHLAKKYGISDVALKKHCRKLGIPTPPVGHWARVQHGRKSVIPKLPTIRSDQENETTINPVRSLAKARPKIKFADYSDKPMHSLLTGPKGKAQMPAGLDVSVSPKLLDRTFGFLSALFYSFEAQGFVLSIEVAGKVKQSRVLVDGEWVSFAVDEVIDRLTPGDPRRSRWSKAIYIPSGRLRFQIPAYFREGLRHRWVDGVKPLELLLDSISKGVAEISGKLKIERERHERWEHEQKMALEIKLREEEAARRIRLLHSDAARWKEADILRGFINHVEVRLGQIGDADVTGWLLWARRLADGSDPTACAAGSFLNRYLADTMVNT